jgi:ABC-type dipeptide/oligopeptide/nickel transport system permease subunit
LNVVKERRIVLFVTLIIGATAGIIAGLFGGIVDRIVRLWIIGS